MLTVEILKAFLIGIIQGVTEWLPVSSTGHMILFNDIFPLSVSARFWDLFSVVIQLGSIMAVVLIYFKRLNPFSSRPLERRASFSIWGRVIVASLPVALVGFIFDDFLAELLYEDADALSVRPIGAVVIAVALIGYGLAFILIEKLKKGQGNGTAPENISYKTALAIGAFESLAVIPGTSRSGSTILGARLLGLSRTAATEFSFFLAVPAMLGAGALKTVKFILDGVSVTSAELTLLAVGCVTAFLVSLLVIGFLTDFVKKHSFIPFGIYRILLGAAVIVWICIK